MPNRILRDWTDSYAIDRLSQGGEVFFTRLIMKADDFGRFHADCRLLKSFLFPLRSDVKDEDIDGWLNECRDAELITTYSANKKMYLQVRNFKQQLRVKKSKFPSPDNHPKDEKTSDDSKRIADATQTHSKRIADDTQKRDNQENGLQQPKNQTVVKNATQMLRKRIADAIPETESEVETETNNDEEEEETDKKNSPPPPLFDANTFKKIESLKTDCENDKIYFIENIIREFKISPEEISKKLEDFNRELQSNGEMTKTKIDYRKHFKNWLRRKSEILNAKNQKNGNTKLFTALSAFGS